MSALHAQLDEERGATGISSEAYLLAGRLRPLRRCPGCILRTATVRSTHAGEHTRLGMGSAARHVAAAVSRALDALADSSQ